MWLPIATPLKVVHSLETIKQIEKYMGLTPDTPKIAQPSAAPNGSPGGSLKKAYHD